MELDNIRLTPIVFISISKSSIYIAQFSSEYTMIQYITTPIICLLDGNYSIITFYNTAVIHQNKRHDYSESTSCGSRL